MDSNNVDVVQLHACFMEDHDEKKSATIPTVMQSNSDGSTTGAGFSVMQADGTVTPHVT
eukprot:JP436477.1.p5 GENE.JP436477.1~~JP436477.1.p5  ORF type:complete len:59 (-),score=6.07 JP436477.1:564-740(-)